MVKGPQSTALPRPQARQAIIATDPETEIAQQVAIGDVRYRLPLPMERDFVLRTLPAEVSTNVVAFRERARIEVGKGYLQQLGLFPGENLLLLVSSDESTVRIYHRESKRLLGNYAIPQRHASSTGPAVAWPELASDGTPMFLTTSGSELTLFSATTGEALATLAACDCQALRWSPDGRILVAVATGQAQQASTMRFFHRKERTLELVGELQLDERVDAWDLSRDNGLLALALYPSGSLHVVDLHDGADVLKLRGPAFAGDVALSPDGRMVAVGGNGLLVVDLLNPDRRAFYSHIYNNIGCVKYSPGGDVLAAGSYDGRVRLFHLVPGASQFPGRPNPIELELLTELRHAGQSNVYSLVFEADGLGLLSAAGDRTVRWFRSPSLARGPQVNLRAFRDLAAWRRDEPRAEAHWSAPSPPAVVDGHYAPFGLREAPRPSRLLPGRYACKIAAMYRLRDCLVTRDENGRTLLEFGPENLLGLKGVVYDDGEVIRFEGWLTRPSTIIDCEGCLQQPIHGLLRGHHGNFRGLVTFRNYFDPNAPPLPPPIDAKIEEALDRFPIELHYQGP